MDELAVAIDALEKLRGVNLMVDPEATQRMTEIVEQMREDAQKSRSRLLSRLATCIENAWDSGRSSSETPTTDPRNYTSLRGGFSARKI